MEYQLVQFFLYRMEKICFMERGSEEHPHNTSDKNTHGKINSVANISMQIIITLNTCIKTK